MKSERHILKSEMQTNCNCPECRAYRRKNRLRAKRAAKRQTCWEGDEAINERSG